MRRWLVVFDDPDSELTTPEEFEAYLRELIREPFTRITVNTVQRGGLLAEKIVGELVPVRHARMGRPAS